MRGGHGAAFGLVGCCGCSGGGRAVERVEGLLEACDLGGEAEASVGGEVDWLHVKILV